MRKEVGDFKRHEHYRRLQRHTKIMEYFASIPNNALVCYHSNY